MLRTRALDRLGSVDQPARRTRASVASFGDGGSLLGRSSHGRGGSLVCHRGRLGDRPLAWRGDETSSRCRGRGGRRDQALVHAGLCASWALFALDPPGSGWRPWDGAPIHAPAFQLQARSEQVEFDLFTEDIDDQRWRFRRDHRISLPIRAISMTSSAGVPIVRPEIQLLYMAASNEHKNERDFEAARPHLSDGAAAWLTEALQITLPGHHWIAELASLTRP